MRAAWCNGLDKTNSIKQSVPDALCNLRAKQSIAIHTAAGRSARLRQLRACAQIHERFSDARRAEAALRAAAKEADRAFGRGAQPTLMFTAALALSLRFGSGPKKSQLACPTVVACPSCCFGVSRTSQALKSNSAICWDIARSVWSRF